MSVEYTTPSLGSVQEAVAELEVVSPTLLIAWMALGVVCVGHVFLLRSMGPSAVHFFCGESGIKAWLVRTGIARSAVTPFARWISTGWPLWVFALGILLYRIFFEGPLDFIIQILGNPNLSRAFGMIFVVPIGIAAACWTFFSSKLASRLLAPVSNGEVIVWVTVMVAGSVSLFVEVLREASPKTLDLLLGDLTPALFYTCVGLACAFACVVAGLDYDGNKDAASTKELPGTGLARSLHLLVLAIALLAAVAAVFVVPAVDRRQFAAANVFGG